MPLLARGSSVMRNLFRRERVDQDLDEEIRSYLDALVEEKVAAGMSPDAARRAAAIEVGGVEQVKERVRQARAGALLESLLQDLRYGLRTLARNPGFTAAAVLTLGLGIGANTAIFSVVNSVLLSPLAGRDPDRLVMLWETTQDAPQVPVSYPNYLDWRQRVRSFEDIAVYNSFDQFTMTGEGDPERVRGGLASGNLFTVIGVEPVAGRLLDSRDDRLDAEPVAVISEGFWRRRFAADPRVVGKPIVLDGNAYTIVGMLPPSFRIAGSEVWLPLGRFTHTPRFIRTNHPGLIGIGRLKPKVTIDQMLADLGAVALPLANVTTLNDALDSSVAQERFSMLMLGLFAALALVLAAVGIYGLIAYSVAQRSQEIGVRIALGARRADVLALVVGQAMRLTLLGIVIGAAAALGAGRGIDSLLFEVEPSDPAVLASAALLVAAVALLAAGLPALRAAQTDPRTALSEG